MRYFIIFYIATGYNHHQQQKITGNISVTNETYPPKSELALLIKARGKVEEVEQVVITNVIELNEQDYNSWNS